MKFEMKWLSFGVRGMCHSFVVPLCCSVGPESVITRQTLTDLTPAVTVSHYPESCSEERSSKQRQFVVCSPCRTQIVVPVQRYYAQNKEYSIAPWCLFTQRSDCHRIKRNSQWTGFTFIDFKLWSRDSPSLLICHNLFWCKKKCKIVRKDFFESQGSKFRNATPPTTTSSLHCAHLCEISPQLKDRTHGLNGSTFFKSAWLFISVEAANHWNLLTRGLQLEKGKRKRKKETISVREDRKSKRHMPIRDGTAEASGQCAGEDMKLDRDDKRRRREEAWWTETLREDGGELKRQGVHVNTTNVKIPQTATIIA